MGSNNDNLTMADPDLDYDLNDTYIYDESDELDVDWSYLYLVAFGFTSCLLVASLFLNVANICTVASHNGLRSTGYFHLVALFSTINIVYFVIATFMEAITTLSIFQLLPSAIAGLIGQNFWLLQTISDVNNGLLGLQILILCVMTMEERLNLSRQFYFKPKGQTCFRIFLTFMAFIVAIISLVIITLLRMTDVFFNAAENELLASLIIYIVFLMTFTCLPAFIIVIISVINCVSAWHSTRQVPIELKMSQKLDARFAIITTILIMVTVAKLILALAGEIDAYEESLQVVLISSYSLERFQDILLILFPLVTTCILGKRCCCWCCCRSCRPPLDD
jgi:hypothetical protein